jgi:glycosyltransferase involved in cell wall biosynthesis
MDSKIIPEISVIICTHNPRKVSLDRVLEALRGQSFPMERWELLLIDNKSSEPLADRVDLGWHSAGRVVREEELGLTQARVRGIRESLGELLVFVDDDNVLRKDYLERAVQISHEWPKLGAWSGRVVPEYEVPPPTHLKPYLFMLCIREVEADLWGNAENYDSTPWGAGMCVRKKVATQYSADVISDPVKAMLDRRGTSLASSGDIDLARTSLKMGLGTGVFPRLALTHLIPKSRLSNDYILKLVEDSTAANYVFYLSKLSSQDRHSTIDMLVQKYKYLRASKFEKQMADSKNRGIACGKKILAEIVAKFPDFHKLKELPIS